MLRPSLLGAEVDMEHTSCEFVSSLAWNESDRIALVYQSDKSYRRYSVLMEKTLSSFDGASQEWADYVSFLNRLIRVSRDAETFEN